MTVTPLIEILAPVMAAIHIIQKSNFSVKEK